MKCLGLRHVTKCLKRTGALTFIWSVMSHLPSASEQCGLNGGKASDWLRPYTPNWALSDFAGGVRLSSSNKRGRFEPIQFLILSKLEGSEVQLTKKQVVLSMHDTLPQGVKSARALLQKRRYYNEHTEISYIKSLSLTIMGHLKGRRIENITKCIDTMLQYKNYKLRFTISYNYNELQITKRSLEEGSLRSPHQVSA